MKISGRKCFVFISLTLIFSAGLILVIFFPFKQSVILACLFALLLFLNGAMFISMHVFEKVSRMKLFNPDNPFTNGSLFEKKNGLEDHPEPEKQKAQENDYVPNDHIETPSGTTNGKD